MPDTPLNNVATAFSATAADALELNTTSDPANLAPTRKSIESYCLAHGLNQRAADEVGLCFNEAMANVTRHAYAGATDRPIVVRATDVNGSVFVTIRDWGNGVNPDCMPRKPKDPMVPGGLGLICMHELLDAMHFTPQPDGMLLTMEKRKST